MKRLASAAVSPLHEGLTQKLAHGRPPGRGYSPGAAAMVRFHVGDRLEPKLEGMRCKENSS